MNRVVRGLGKKSWAQCLAAQHFAMKPYVIISQRANSSSYRIPCPGNGCVTTTTHVYDPEMKPSSPSTLSGPNPIDLHPVPPSSFEWPQYALDVAKAFVSTGYEHIHRYYYPRMYFTSHAADQGRETVEFYFRPGPLHPEYPAPHTDTFPLSPTPEDISSLVGSTAVGEGKQVTAEDPPLLEHPSYPHDKSVGSLAGIVHFGPFATGPPDCVHGGAIATLADVLMFRAVEGCGMIGFTANLNINYRAVIPVGHAVVMRVNVAEAAARKITANFGIFSPDHRVLYAEGSGLFIKPHRWENDPSKVSSFR